MENTSFKDFLQKVEGKEGIVLLGTGGNPEEWINGIAGLLKEEGISTASTPEELFTDRFMLKTTGGRTDLALVVDFDKAEVDKMAMWRLRFGECSWISDYKVNYASHH
jgi:hypothetical protein